MTSRPFQRELMDRLLGLEVGQSIWFPTDRHTEVLSTVARAKQRRPKALRDREFQTATWTAVKARGAGIVRVIVEITRIV